MAVRDRACSWHGRRMRPSPNRRGCAAIATKRKQVKLCYLFLLFCYRCCVWYLYLLIIAVVQYRWREPCQAACLNFTLFYQVASCGLCWHCFSNKASSCRRGVRALARMNRTLSILSYEHCKQTDWVRYRIRSKTSILNLKISND